MAAPALDGVLQAIDHRQHTGLIKFAEGTGFELGAGMGNRAGGERLEVWSGGQVIKELVQMALDRLH